MADAVATNVIANLDDHYVVHLTGISDGSGEAAVIKVDKSTLLARDGAEPASLDIEAVRWNIQGHASVRILWDHTTDDVALVLAGSGYEDWKGQDIARQPAARTTLADPRSAGGAGDILLTTNGHAAGCTYDITLWLVKNPN